jgi:hypothetical protein
MKELTDQLLALLAERTDIVNFWGKPTEVTTLKGDASDIFIMSDIYELETEADLLSTEVTALAENRAKYTT